MVIGDLHAGFVPVVRLVMTSRALASDVTHDLESLMATHPGETMEMGYGDLKSYYDPQYQLTYYRPVLVFAGNPYTIDAVALFDFQLSGLALPDSTITYLKSCKTRIWLVAKNSPPFSMVTVYTLIDARVLPGALLFSDAFREVFFDRYRKQGSSRYFDVWECTPSA